MNFSGGIKTSVELRERMEARSGLAVTMGSDASAAALRCYGDIKRIGVVTPYWPSGDAMVRKYFEESGLELLLRGSAQLALDPLLPFERFSVGGYYSVRGYRENQLVRDNGFSFGLDARLPLRRTPAGRTLLRAGPFVDVGRSWNQGRGVTEGKKTLASVGVAVAWWPWPWLRAEFSYGARLVDIDRPENRP